MEFGANNPTSQVDGSNRSGRTIGNPAETPLAADWDDSLEEEPSPGMELYHLILLACVVVITGIAAAIVWLFTGFTSTLAIVTTCIFFLLMLGVKFIW